jgi:hypothetical protein
VNEEGERDSEGGYDTSTQEKRTNFATFFALLVIIISSLMVIKEDSRKEE